jgi:DNA-binding NtrC family response regulator
MTDMDQTVLIVDDDANVRNGLLRVLRQQPYQILTARTAADAILCIKKHAVDLVVSDDQMPGMSGIELLTWVAAHRPDIIRIMLTGEATTGSAIQAINEAKVHRFFTKPCNHVELAMTIRKALEERAAALGQTTHP